MASFPSKPTTLLFRPPSFHHPLQNSVLPNIKTSLSLTLTLTLQHFFPLAGNLIIPPRPTNPYFIYTAGDSISLTVAESNADFNHISGQYQSDVQNFHHLVPSLPYQTESHDPFLPSPLLAVQVTVFPQRGISIGLAFRQVAADGRTFNNFLKSWASIFKMGPDLKRLPSIDMTVIKDPNGLEPILLEQWWNHGTHPQPDTDNDDDGADLQGLVRATFVMDRPKMEILKNWILTRSDHLFGSSSMYLSPYVLTCSWIWVCLTNIRFSNIKNNLGKEPHYFGFTAGGITRLGYPVPDTYLGNCVSFGRSVAMGDELVGEDGIVIAAKAIGETIEKLNGEVLGGAEDWISDWKELLGSELHVMVTGSPKVDLWGRPRKIEEIAIEKTRAVSLRESRDVEGGIEVGLVLPKAKNGCFRVYFEERSQQRPSFTSSVSYFHYKKRENC